MGIGSLLDIVGMFGLVNDYTENPRIWVGHSKIGGRGQPSIEETKQILSNYFGKCVADAGEEVPDWLKKNLEQWHDFHPFQQVRENDQPLFAKKLDEKRILVAVIWPWRIRKGIASLMVYEGELSD